jgi:hypothetical protein
MAAPGDSICSSSTQTKRALTEVAEWLEHPQRTEAPLLTSAPALVQRIAQGVSRQLEQYRQIEAKLSDLDDMLPALDAELARTRQELQDIASRFELIRRITSDAFWDMQVSSDTPLDPRTPVWWSDQLLALLGYGDETDYPDFLGSWIDRLHPEDHQRTLDLFASYLNERNFQAPLPGRVPPVGKNRGISLVPGPRHGHARAKWDGVAHCRRIPRYPPAEAARPGARDHRHPLRDIAGDAQ